MSRFFFTGSLFCLNSHIVLVLAYTNTLHNQKFDSLGIDYTPTKRHHSACKYVQHHQRNFHGAIRGENVLAYWNEPFVEIVVNSVIMRKPLRQCGRITIPLCTHTATSSSMLPEKPKRTHFPFARFPSSSPSDAIRMAILLCPARQKNLHNYWN